MHAPLMSRRGFVVGACSLASLSALPALAAGTKPNLVVGIVSDPHANGGPGPEEDH